MCGNCDVVFSSDFFHPPSTPCLFFPLPKKYQLLKLQHFFLVLAASPNQPYAIQHRRYSMVVPPWNDDKNKKIRYTYLDARSHDIHRFSLGRYMDNNLGWENFCTTSLYEDYETCPCTGNKPTLQCQCEASVKGRYIYEQVGSNFKLQPCHADENLWVTKLFWNHTRVNAAELYANWGAFVSTFLTRPYFRIPAIVIEPMFSNGIFKCDIHEKYKQELAEEIPKDICEYEPALRHTWRTISGTISTLDDFNIKRAAPWLSFLFVKGCRDNLPFFRYFNDFRWIFSTHPPVTLLKGGFRSIHTHEREFFPSLTCTLRTKLDDLFQALPKWDPRRKCNEIRGNPNTYPLLGFNAPIQVELYDKRQGSTLTPSMRDLLLMLHMPTSVFLMCQHSPRKHWKRMWQIFKTMAINLYDLKQEFWCTVHNLPPIHSILQYTTGGFYTLRKTHSIEKALTHFRRNGTPHYVSESIRTPLREMAAYEQINNHLIFKEQQEDELPTTTNIANKQERLGHTSININNILTKQPPADPNTVKLHSDFHVFGTLPRGPTGWPLENSETSWEFCSRFFVPPKTQFSQYQVQHRNALSAFGQSAKWILHQFHVLLRLHPVELRRILHQCHNFIQESAPTFTPKEAEAVAEKIKKLFKERSLDEQNWKSALHSIIALLDRSPGSQQWFLNFMKFYNNGFIKATCNFKKRIKEPEELPPAKRAKPNTGTNKNRKKRKKV